MDEDVNERFLILDECYAFMSKAKLLLAEAVSTAVTGKRREYGYNGIANRERNHR